MTKTMQPLGTRLRAVGIALALAIVLVPAVVGTKSAEAQTFKVLYSFTGGADGGEPLAGLVRDAAGNLYGTTLYGGSGGPYGNGVVFELDNAGTETVLYTFTGGTDGGFPYAGLVRDAAGNLYGTTSGGGAYGEGTVFMLDKTGTETVLYSFCSQANCTDGACPMAGLLLDAAGNLYGTTESGGSSNCYLGCGIVFMLDNTGTETVLYSFTGAEGDGEYPVAGLVRDAAGNLYGTTWRGGNLKHNCGMGPGCGTAFMLDEAGKETVLHSFGSKADGAYPYAGLVRDAAGNLYGTTGYGGDSGLGTAFRLDKTGNETVLHSFRGTRADGAYPEAGFVRDSKGNLYGTTEGGGFNRCDGSCGVVFKLDKTGKETVLYRFTGGSDGEGPSAGLVRDAKGNLYGTAYWGGAGGQGTVFKLTP